MHPAFKLTKLKLEVLKSDFQHKKERYEHRLTCISTGKILLEFDFSSSLLLKYGPTQVCF